MDNITATVLTVLGALVLFALLVINRKNAFAKLQALLNKGDYKAYLQLLDDKFIKATLSQKELLVMQLEGSMMLREDEKAQQIIKKLDTVSFGKEDLIAYYRKRLDYFIALGNTNEAEKSYSMLCQSVDMANMAALGEDMKQQAKLSLDVFLYKDVSRIDELLKLEAQQEESMAKGMTQYLLAHLFHAKGDDDTATDYLAKAAALLGDSQWGMVAKAASRDLSLLENK